MKDTSEHPSENPMEHPEEQPSGIDNSPKFGRLLLVLVIAVMSIGAVAILAGTYLT